MLYHTVLYHYPCLCGEAAQADFQYKRKWKLRQFRRTPHVVRWVSSPGFEEAKEVQIANAPSGATQKKWEADYADQAQIICHLKTIYIQTWDNPGCFLSCTIFRKSTFVFHLCFGSAEWISSNVMLWPLNCSHLVIYSFVELSEVCVNYIMLNYSGSYGYKTLYNLI